MIALKHEKENVHFGIEGRKEGGTIPPASSHWGAPKSSKNIASTFFSTVHLLPKDLRFERGGANLVSYPERHLTSLRPW